MCSVTVTRTKIACWLLFAVSTGGHSRLHVLDLGVGAHSHAHTAAATLRSHALALRVAAADFSLPPPPDDALEPVAVTAPSEAPAPSHALQLELDASTRVAAAATALTSGAICELLVALLGEQRVRHLPYRRVATQLFVSFRFSFRFPVLTARLDPRFQAAALEHSIQIRSSE